MDAEIIEIPRTGLHRQVVERLRSLLIEGHIEPGAKLNERELCAKLRVSRTPLREAIKLLAAEGLVDLVPNRGAVAVRLTEADVVNTFEVLAHLEGLSGELAAQRITPAALDELRALHYEMLACYARRDLPGYYRLNALIHAGINDAVGNPVLTATYRSINARVQSLRFRSNQNEVKWKLAVAEHEQMMEMLAARDGAGLKTLLIQHLNHKRDAVVASLQAGEIYPNGAAF